MNYNYLSPLQIQSNTGISVHENMNHGTNKKLEQCSSGRDLLQWAKCWGITKVPHSAYYHACLKHSENTFWGKKTDTIKVGLDHQSHNPCIDVFPRTSLTEFMPVTESHVKEIIIN